MPLSHNTYKDRDALIKDLKKEVLLDFKQSDYTESDKLHVSMHRVIDNFVSFISIADTDTYLKFFDYTDKETIDKGLLPEFDSPYFDRAMLFCLVEQDLYNDESINKLQ